MSRRAELLLALAERLNIEAQHRAAPNQMAIAVAPADVKATLDAVVGFQGRPLAVHGALRDGRLQVSYVLDIEDDDLIVILVTTLDEPRDLASVVGSYPGLARDEREMAARHRVRLRHSPDPSVQPDRDPLAIDGTVSRWPRGPIQAPLTDSRQLRWVVAGDRIVHGEPHLGFKTRRAQDRVRGLGIDQALAVVERVCAQCAASNAIGFVLALEGATAFEPPERATWLRTGIAELERLRTYCAAVAHLVAACAWPAGAERTMSAHDELVSACAASLGARTLRDLVTYGGVRREPIAVGALKRAVTQSSVQVRRLIHEALEHPAVQTALSRRGVIESDVIQDLGVTGPVARASGARRDVRSDHPYLAYSQLSIWMASNWAGDALGRLRVWQEEIEQSTVLLEEILGNLPPGPYWSEPPAAPADNGLALVEAPHGCQIHAVSTDADGRILDWSLHAASSATWQALPFAVQDHRRAELAVIERSLSLCVACVDR